MSAKKSFDISSKPKKLEVQKETSGKRSVKKVPKKQPPPPKKRLRQRREEDRARGQFVTLVIAALLFGAVVYGLWQPGIRIQEVRADALEKSDDVVRVAQEVLDGTYYFIIPKDSFFFYPEKEIQDQLHAMFPRIASLSISRDGFTALSIEGTLRETGFYWCGTEKSMDSMQEVCYDADQNGFVFMKSDAFSTTTETLLVYGALDAASSTQPHPISSRVVGYEHVPSILAFRHSIESFGVLVPSASIRGDEVDLYLESGTRLTYVLGSEEEALTDITVALPALNLKDGSIEYIDLRFKGKLYVKRSRE